MKSKTKETLVRVILSPIHKASVVALGLYTLIWGWWVANPFWSVFEQAALFSTMGVIAPEVFWGTVAIISGTGILISAWKLHPRGLMDAALITSVHWLWVAIFYFLGDWQNTGGITSLFIALYAAFIYLNIKVNYYIKHKRKEQLFVRR